VIEPALAGFVGTPRYWSPTDNKTIAKIGPGEYYVTRSDEILGSVLGSCIAVCIYDIKNGVGGMNHFMLPMSKDKNVWSDTYRFGDRAMEVLIDAICINGGDRQNLQYKAFGGGQMLKNMTPIGDSNIKFLHQFMEQKHISIVSADLGGANPRLLKFYPKTGRAFVKKLQEISTHQVIDEEIAYFNRIEQGKGPPEPRRLFE